MNITGRLKASHPIDCGGIVVHLRLMLITYVFSIIVGAYLTFVFAMPKQKHRWEWIARIAGGFMLVGGLAGFVLTL